jgi:hypothetical protein
VGVARTYLAVLLAAMAAGQLGSWEAFTDAVATYDAGPLAVPLVLAELAGAGGLLLGRRRVGAIAGVLAAGLWTALAVQALARGLDVPNCGCFGEFLSQPLRWWVLPQDALFLALALAVFRRELRPAPVPAAVAPASAPA